MSAGSFRSDCRQGVRAAWLLLAALPVFLTGCKDQETRDAINHRAMESRQSLDTFAAPVPPKRYNPLVVTDKIWTGSQAQRMQRGRPLPARFETARGVTVISSSPLSLGDIAGIISSQTGIPVNLQGAGMSSVSAAPAAPASSAPGGFTTPAMEPVVMEAPAGSVMPVAYEGPLSGLLERVSGYFGLSWKYDGATLSISRFQTQVFAIEALPGTQKIEEGMQDDQSSGGSGGSGSSAGGGGGGNSQNTMTQNSKTSMDIKYWDEIGQIITSMLGGTGNVVVSPSVGTITVTTTPEIMRSVAQYIGEENQRLSRQIAINVEIYVVSLSEGMDFTVAFDTMLRRLTNFGANFSSAGAPSTVSGFTGGGALSVAILNPATVGEVTDVFTALSGVGDTTKVAKFPVVTLNNRPVSRRVGRNISFVAEAGTTFTGTTGSPSTFVTPGVVRQGFSVQLTPRLLDDGRILLQYSLSITDLLALKTFNSQCGDAESEECTAGAASTTVQLPDTANRTFVQQSVLKSGSMLVIGGAEEEDLSQNSQGVGNPYNYLLGGGLSSGKTHSMIFFALTPQVLDVPRAEQG